jgi:transcriptional regulator with XRE-family HTH domain
MDNPRKGVVPMRTSTRLSPKEAGEALKRAVHVARSQAGIGSDVEISVRSGVSYDTLHNWYSGRTTPRPFQVRKVADLLDVPLDTLMAAYEGREPGAKPVEDELREVAASVRALTKRLDRFLDEEAARRSSGPDFAAAQQGVQALAESKSRRPRGVPRDPSTERR